jgi:hypothetical protein
MKSEDESNGSTRRSDGKDVLLQEGETRKCRPTIMRDEDLLLLLDGYG